MDVLIEEVSVDAKERTRYIIRNEDVQARVGVNQAVYNGTIRGVQSG